MTQESPPDSRRPLDTYYDVDMGRLQTYSMEVLYLAFMGYVKLHGFLSLR